ncbi:probable low affinity copper uptake protein 2 isoform X2 [Belonocnema kinseyi]|uniref:probable low affinity copper uptake protein 2 isoform X2 n=1 Tax=Belonocnema kinseyi TaxID=2817044 RepID=UPI00143D0450|nr:probable low affinity copper uptake protein 2 isoform X2 [Belonocnema kinseyi]
MHMWYWLGIDLESFLFSGYNVSTTVGLVATCFGLAALAVLYEGMKIAQIKLRQLSMASILPDGQRTSENSSLLFRIYPRSFKPFTSCRCESWSKWLLEVCHWSFHTLLGYLLMLAIMTYNGYISIAIALGSCFGYWIFGPSLVESNIAQFQAKGLKIKYALITSEIRESTVSTVADESATSIETNVEVHAPSDAIH